MMTASGTKPGHYSERWLCDLWAGAQCSYTSCEKDARERCIAASKQCASTSRRTTVPEDRASKMSTCARSLLGTKCGAPKPTACGDVMP